MKTQALFLVTLLLIFSLGLTMIFNTTSAEIIGKDVDIEPHFALLKQLMHGGIGLFFALLIYRFGVNRLVQYAHIFFFFSILLLIAVFLPTIGIQLNGAKRWINLGIVSLQPSEFVKITLPLFYLKLYFREKGEISFKTFAKWQILLMLPIFLIALEPDNGTAAILLATLVIFYFLSNIRLLYWMLPILVATITAGTLALSMKHVNDRIYVYLHPEADILGKGHQPYQAKIAAGSGGLFGRGLGESLQKLNYLPEARSDYIAAIYAEEFGFIGIALLIVLYALLALLGFRIALQTKDPHGYFLATIFTFVLSLSTFLNLGVVSGLLPSKGTNLPFFSHGGSSLWTNTFMVAILMNIARTQPKLAN